jgi:hypothetical protein
VSIAFLASCQNDRSSVRQDSAKKQDSIKSLEASNENEDSIKLTKLIRELYKWHATDTTGHDGFKPLKKNITDTFYSSIDLSENYEAIERLKKTGLFTVDFLNDYRKIAVRMDEELRNGKSIWPEGELPTFQDDVDEWCSCQDYPDNYLDKINLVSMSFNKDDVSFKWTWGGNDFYKVKAKKENGSWKISYLEGFDYAWYNWGK